MRQRCFGSVSELQSGTQKESGLAHVLEYFVPGGVQRRHHHHHHHRHRRRRGVGKPGPRAQTRNLAAWICELGNLRHEVTGKILLSVEWSLLQEVDLATVPTNGATRPAEPIHGGHRGCDG